MSVPAQTLQIVTYREGGGEKIGFLVWTKIYELRGVDPNLPETKEQLISEWKRYEARLRLAFASLTKNRIRYPLAAMNITDVDAPALMDLGLLR